MATKNKKSKDWKEGELILQFGLDRITEYQTPLMQEWLDVEMPILTTFEQTLFDITYDKGVQKIAGWSEEDLKMKFITHILDLGHLNDEGRLIGFFDKLIWATVEGIKLIVKSDFMMATGVLETYQKPFFHFQEYKPNKNPTGDSMAQLLESFLIGQTKNEKPIPLYGVEIIGKHWTFVVMEGKQYCISKSFSAIEKDDLLKIIAILRKFKHILMTRLLD